MLEDKFKLSKMNIILIILNIFLVLLVIIGAIQLIRSINDQENTIPNLRTTADKTSTLEADLTSTTTTEETTTTTTKKPGNTNSPYYDINVEELFNNELLSKQSLSQEEKKEIVTLLFNRVAYLIDVTNTDVIDIPNLIENVKQGENDLLEYEGHKYGIIYNGSEYFSKTFRNIKASSVMASKVNGVAVLVESNGNYYKLENTIGDINFKIDSYSVTSSTSTRIEGKMVYYFTNYKEQGLSSPVYKSSSIEIVFDTNSKSWKVEKFGYPNLED